MPHIDAGSWNCAIRYCVIIVNSEDADLKAQASELFSLCIHADRSCMTSTIARMPLLESISANLGIKQPPNLINASCQLLAALVSNFSMKAAALSAFLSSPAVSNVVRRHTRFASTRDSAVDALVALAQVGASGNDYSMDLFRSDVTWYFEALNAEGVSVVTLSKLMSLIPAYANSRQLVDSISSLLQGGLSLAISSCVKRRDPALLLQCVLTLNVILNGQQQLNNNNLSQLAVSLVTDGTVAEAFSQVERNSPSSEVFLDFLERVSRESAAQLALQSSLFTQRMDLYLSLIKSESHKNLDRCLGITYNLLSNAKDLPSHFGNSTILDTCIHLACSSSLSPTKYWAWRIVSLALPHRVCREKLRNECIVDDLVTSLLLLMNKEASISDQSIIFTSLAYILFHITMLHYQGHLLPNTAYITRIIGSDCFMSLSVKCFNQGISCKPFLFALHALACFPDFSTHAMLHARLRDSFIIEKLFDLCCTNVPDEVLQMALLAFGSLIGCNAYFPHLAVEVSERIEITKNELTVDERHDLIIAERAALFDNSKRVQNVPLKSVIDMAKRVLEKGKLTQLLLGAYGLQSCVATLRLLSILCEDRGFSRSLVLSHTPASQNILNFSSFLVTLVGNFYLGSG